ncbi:MAG: DUF3833 family protein, partial [Gammaproteobacteria bacterium]
ASDIIGEAKGRQADDYIHMTYEMLVPVDDKTYQFKFDDWLYKINDQVVLNHAKIKKFGFTVGEIVLSFEKYEN